LKSSPEKQARWHLRLVPRSIVARTSLSILVLAVVMGLAFALLASWRMRAAEHDRLIARVHEITATVESTVSIACFLNDATLAREIAAGLMKNRIVAGVRITSGGESLYAAGVIKPAVGRRSRIDAFPQTIYSPFDRQDEVGRIILYVSSAEIEAQAAAYSRYTIWILSLQVSIVAAAVAFLVYLLVTRPIKGISDELHRLEIRSGMRLTWPSGNRQDEIGQLVLDVNSLIGRLTNALANEHDLRVAHEISERRMRLVFEKADTGMLVLDESGAVQSCNPSFVRILGPAAAKRGALLDELLQPHGPLIAGLIESAKTSGEPREADLEVDAGPGRGKIWVELSVNRLGTNLLQGLVNDITERKRAEVAARELAERDPVTGLLNRRGIDAALVQVLERPIESRARPALLQIDLDHFKAVNDTHGHDAGDHVLRAVARVLEKAVRRSDFVGRSGGDEFQVILAGVERESIALEVANKIIAGVAQPIDVGGAQFVRVGASIGIALGSGEYEPPASFLRRADEAMYEVKQTGRGCARVAAAAAVQADSDSAAA
jgi:diguanylate cyclase (GGDEF)-like protein/PAS domain S-box-containing protein